MNYSQSLNPQKFNNLESTHIPTYGSIRVNDHPNEMRVSGRYGERSIPGSVFLSRNKSLDHIGHKAAYELGRSTEQQQGIATQQAHHPLPLYTYGQQCQPCNQQSYMLPVYYEEPIRVREEWERPLDSNIHEQEWRFVKTEDKGGVVKYVTKDEEMVETVGQSQWREYYKGKKQSQPPVIVPERETRTCCTPVLFALLGFLALGGLVLGLVLLLNSHQATLPKESYRSGMTYVEPTPGQLTEELPAVPISQQVAVTTTSQPSQYITRPTYTQSITAQPKETVQTQLPQTFISKESTINTQPISMSYGYQTNTQTDTMVDYNNDYQVRPVTEEPTVGYAQVGGDAVMGYEQMTIAPRDVNDNGPVATLEGETRGNYDFNLPEGYRIDENGMAVPL